MSFLTNTNLYLITLHITWHYNNNKGCLKGTIVISMQIILKGTKKKTLIFLLIISMRVFKAHQTNAAIITQLNKNNPKASRHAFLDVYTRTSWNKSRDLCQRHSVKNNYFFRSFIMRRQRLLGSLTYKKNVASKR